MMNSAKKTRTGNRSVARMATAVALASAAAFTLAGCATPASPASTAETSAASPAPTEDKAGTYAELIFDSTSPAYTPDAEKLTQVTAFGWTADQVTAGHRLAVDYVVNEFLDSSALEGGDEAYRKWHANEAKNFISDTLHASTANGEGTLVVGNIAGRFMVPELIHDGSPRLKDLNVGVTDTFSTGQNGQGPMGLVYTIGYSGNYRVSDASAATFMSDYSMKALPAEKRLTPEQFLASDLSTPMLKDGAGENRMKISGIITVALIQNAAGEFVINGFKNDSELQIKEFTVNEDYFTKP